MQLGIPYNSFQMISFGLLCFPVVIRAINCVQTKQSPLGGKGDDMTRHEQTHGGLGLIEFINK